MLKLKTIFFDRYSNLIIWLRSVGSAFIGQNKLFRHVQEKKFPNQ